MNIITTKQVNRIAIDEDLFHEVVEGQIPTMIKKQTTMLKTFFDRLISYIEEHAKRTDWFYMENCDLLYHNTLVALFPNFQNFELGSCRKSAVQGKIAIQTAINLHGKQRGEILSQVHSP